MKPSAKKVGDLGVGVLSGIGLNGLWTVLKIPGYDTPVYSNVNAGDVVQVGIGAVIAGYGYKKKSSQALMTGIGIPVGVLMTKLIQMYASTFTISRARVSSSMNYSNVVASTRSSVPLSSSQFAPAEDWWGAPSNARYVVHTNAGYTR